VTTAADGAEALTLAGGAQRADIMLLDLEMPRMDGFEVLEAIRASDAWRDLPVIRGHRAREDVAAIDRAFQAGATDFVVKPMNWRLPELSDSLRAALQPRRLRGRNCASSAQGRSDRGVGQARGPVPCPGRSSRSGRCATRRPNWRASPKRRC